MKTSQNFLSVPHHSKWLEVNLLWLAHFPWEGSNRFVREREQNTVTKKRLLSDHLSWHSPKEVPVKWEANIWKKIAINTSKILEYLAMLINTNYHRNPRVKSSPLKNPCFFKKGIKCFLLWMGPHNKYKWVQHLLTIGIETWMLLLKKQNNKKKLSIFVRGQVKDYFIVRLDPDAQPKCGLTLHKLKAQAMFGALKRRRAQG